jgi:hypothetical protein
VQRIQSTSSLARTTADLLTCVPISVLCALSLLAYSSRIMNRIRLMMFPMTSSRGCAWINACSWRGSGKWVKQTTRAGGC